MKSDKSLDSEFIDFFPEMEYFLNAHLSSLLNGYVPPIKNVEITKNNEPEVLDDDFFIEVDKNDKF